MKEPLFFKAARNLSAAEICTLTGAKLLTPEYAHICIDELAPLHSAHKGSLAYIRDKKYLQELKECQAGIIVCGSDFVEYAPKNAAIISSENPYGDFVQIGRLLFPQSIKPKSVLGIEGISPQAYIHPSAKIGEDVTIEPGVFIGKDAEIGAHSILSASSIIGESCKIGCGCYISAHVSIQYAMIGDNVFVHPGAQIGQDGFGYFSSANGVVKIPQIGRVIIQDNVEIGANTTIDRGSLEDTVIGEGTKIDNLVQIAHNVQIGRYCIIAAHSGISGSVHIGDRSLLGGRVGIKDHVKIGKAVQIAAASGVMRNIPDNEKWGGIPARPLKQWLQEISVLKVMSKPNKKRSPDERQS